MRLLLALLLLAGVAYPTPAEVLRVWSEKYPTIQSAIDAAKPKDVVLVGKGHFWQSIDFKGKAITVTSEFGPDHTAIRGTVQFVSGEGRGSVLEGFSIWPAAAASGRIGIKIVNASPTVRGNIIGRSYPEPWHEAGITCNGGRPRIEGNLIHHGRHYREYNSSALYASGIRLYASDAEVMLNRLKDNHTRGITSTKVNVPGFGGAMFVSGGAPRIEGNLIQGNRCEGIRADGGGLYLDGSRALVFRNAILDNELGSGGMGPGTHHGGGIYSTGGSVEIQGNVIVGNQVGKGVTPPFQPRGGGVFCDSGRIVNNTIDSNVLHSAWLSGEGGGIYGSAKTEVRNNILWNNSSAKERSLSGVPSMQVHTNLIGDGQFKGVNGNMSDDPRFLNEAGRDFHLRPGSPCIDTGSLPQPPVTVKDFDFEPRVIDGRADTHEVTDMGADEFASLRKPLEFTRPGATVPLSIFAAPAAGRTYILACALGSKTGIPMPPPDPRRIPLDPDALFWASLAQNNAVFSRFLGLLDSKGEASASIRVPDLSALAGVTLHAAGVAVLPNSRIVILNRLDIDVLP